MSVVLHRHNQQCRLHWFSIGHWRSTGLQVLQHSVAGGSWRLQMLLWRSGISSNHKWMCSQLPAADRILWTHKPAGRSTRGRNYCAHCVRSAGRHLMLLCHCVVAVQAHRSRQEEIEDDEWTRWMESKLPTNAVRHGRRVQERIASKQQRQSATHRQSDSAVHKLWAIHSATKRASVIRTTASDNYIQVKQSIQGFQSKTHPCLVSDYLCPEQNSSI